MLNVLVHSWGWLKHAKSSLSYRLIAPVCQRRLIDKILIYKLFMKAILKWVHLSTGRILVYLQVKLLSFTDAVFATWFNGGSEGEWVLIKPWLKHDPLTLARKLKSQLFMSLDIHLFSSGTIPQRCPLVGEGVKRSTWWLQLYDWRPAPLETVSSWLFYTQPLGITLG